MKNVILTGFMGTGKSSVGEILAGKLGYKYRDIDSLIVEHSSMTINQIFEKFGEESFRDLETGTLESLFSGERMVISTGGGAVIREKNREMLRSMGCVINLVASDVVIYSRLHMDDGRPLLKDNMSIEKIRKMLDDRERFYADADIRIDTDGKKVEDVVREILSYLEGKNLI
jgi:shikimate kinase